MLRVWWFPEYLPYQRIIFDRIMEIIQQNYKQFWYTQIKTPAVERNEVLTAKSWEEAKKQIFWLYWLAQWWEDLKEYSLRFDLTVPFARYVIDWESELVFPFKRYQIQPVWRGERQQKWRFKEFYQADVDVIWNWWDENNEYLFYDAEVIFLGYKTLCDIFNFLDIGKKPVLHINNINIVQALIEEISWWDSQVAAQIKLLIDKYHKIWKKDFSKWLLNLGLSKDDAAKISQFVWESIDYKDLDKLVWFVDSYKFVDWINALKTVLSYIRKFANTLDLKMDFQIDFSIVRWLDYYTWTVFETFFPDNQELGSIYSGWRYDELTQSINPKKYYGWVWASIWLSRFMSYIFENNLIKIRKRTVTEYLFINFQETFDDIISLAWKFISQWKNIEIYPKPDKLKKQFSYADKKGIKYVVVFWTQEKDNWKYIIKDMKDSSQIEQNFND